MYVGICVCLCVCLWRKAFVSEQYSKQFYLLSLERLKCRVDVENDRRGCLMGKRGVYVVGVQSLPPLLLPLSGGHKILFSKKDIDFKSYLSRLSSLFSLGKGVVCCVSNI